jgi:hypothetical protein
MFFPNARAKSVSRHIASAAPALVVREGGLRVVVAANSFALRRRRLPGSDF